MQTKQICITHHNRTITGIYYKPDRSECFPLVIFSHGYNGSGGDFDRSASTCSAAVRGEGYQL